MDIIKDNISTTDLKSAMFNMNPLMVIVQY
jgi:hypothetical protein